MVKNDLIRIKYLINEVIAYIDDRETAQTYAEDAYRAVDAVIEKLDVKGRIPLEVAKYCIIDAPNAYEFPCKTCKYRKDETSVCYLEASKIVGDLLQNFIEGDNNE